MKTYICKDCGTDNVVRDAWAAWSPHENKWVLETTFDHAHCFNCEGQTSLEEIEYDPNHDYV